MNGNGEFIWKEGKKNFGFLSERKKMDLVFFLAKLNFFVNFKKMENKMDLENF